MTAVLLRLQVEVSLRVTSTCRFDTALRHVRQFLADNFSFLALETDLTDFEDSSILREHIDRISIVEVSGKTNSVALGYRNLSGRFRQRNIKA